MELEFKEFSKKLQLKKFNVANKKSCEEFFTNIEHKQLHVLVNNSGIKKDNLFVTMKEDDFRSVLDTNLIGSFYMSQLAVLNMMKHRYGRIINISSLSARLGVAGQANYAASKAGQVALAKVLSKEVAKRKITVNNISPGFI